MNTLAAYIVLALFLAPEVSVAEPYDDKVLELPGYGPPPTRHWSGFLNASAEEPGTMLHYWLAEAEGPGFLKKPIVLWLNGGPGSSSILGMLQENGPLLINATGGLMQNPYAWTKQANLLILESPGGVGYSYCEAMKVGGNCNNTDISTARAARAAVEDFFRSKFPELLASDLYITGESYAGVYVPTLVAELLDHAAEVNIKGLAVGDPCTDQISQAESMDMLWYAHKNGLVPDHDFSFLWNNCSHRQPSFLSHGHWVREDGRWSAAALPKRSTATEAALLQLRPDLQHECKVALRRFIATTSHGLSQSWDDAYINELDLFTDAAALDWKLPGTLNYFTAQWMMRSDVQQALHVVGSPAKAWPGPPNGWRYQSSYSACNNGAPPGTPSMIDFYRKIAPKLARTIVFNGDVDPCVSYEGTRAAIEKIGFAVLPGGQYRPWFYNHSEASVSTLLSKPTLFGPNLGLRGSGPQFGGQVVDYEHNLSFVTVHGSGHMVPQFRPQAAEQLLAQLLSGGHFSPPLPGDKELGALSDAAFEDAVKQWTKLAKAAVGATPSAERGATAKASATVVI